MSLDYKMLSQALIELEFELRDRKSWVMITEESGVSNVKSIAEGRSKPTVDTWYQLHKAFPEKIPPPQMVDGKVICDNPLSCSGKRVTF